MTDLVDAGSGPWDAVAAGDEVPFSGSSSHAGIATEVFYPCDVSRENALRSVQGWWEQAGCTKAADIVPGHFVDGIFEWCNDRVITRDLVNMAVIGECKLCYVPFWMCTANVAGKLEGYNHNYDSKVRVSKTIDKTYEWTSVAVTDKEIRMKFLRNHRGTAMPYDACQVPAYPLTYSAKDAYFYGHKSIKAAAIKFANIGEVKSTLLNQTHHSLKLVYYPLWVISYSYCGRSYSATVDGVTGKLLAGSAPGDMLMRAVAFFSAILLNMALVTVNLSLLFIRNTYLCCGFILLFGDLLELISVYYMAQAISYFFYGVEITAGDEGGGYREMGAARGIRSGIAMIALPLIFVVQNYLGYMYVKTGGSTTFIVLSILALIVFILASGILYDNAWEPDADVLEVDP